MNKREAGRLGGLAVVNKYGSSYMSEIGRKGAMALYEKYWLKPANLTGWALIDKKTNVVKVTWFTSARIPK